MKVPRDLIPSMHLNYVIMSIIDVLLVHKKFNFTNIVFIVLLKQAMVFVMSTILISKNLSLKNFFNSFELRLVCSSAKNKVHKNCIQQHLLDTTVAT